jgi:hypothetical protein
MQTEKPSYEEIEELLGEVDPPNVALVEQRVEWPAAVEDIRAAVGEVYSPETSAPSSPPPGASFAVRVDQALWAACTRPRVPARPPAAASGQARRRG